MFSYIFIGCTCRRSWRDNMTQANCTARRLYTLPKVPALKEMNASYNLIETIHVDDLPQSLLVSSTIIELNLKINTHLIKDRNLICTY